jgi:hypothetical protein
MKKLAKKIIKKKKKKDQFDIGFMAGAQVAIDILAEEQAFDPYYIAGLVADDIIEK